MPLNAAQINQRMRTGRKLTVKRFVQNLVNMYQDNWYYIILEELSRQVSKETLDKFQFLISQELNVLKRVTNELSMVYKEPAARKAIISGKEINGDGKGIETHQDVEIYEDALKDTNKNEALHAINQYTNLSNNTMLKVTYRDGKLDYDVFLFNNIEIYTNPEDWKEIIAIKYYNCLNVDGEDGMANAYSPVYSPSMSFDDKEKGVGLTPLQDYHSAILWVKKDIKNAGIIEDGSNGEKMIKGGKIYTINPSGDFENIVEEEDIPYLDDSGEPILPFVLYNRVYPVDSLLNFTNGNDVRDLTVNMAILLIYLNSVEKYQSFKQIVFNTDDPDSIPDGMKLGPADILVNPTREGGGSVEVLDLQADIKSKYDMIKERIVNVLTGYGISPQNFTMSAAPTSGFALKISNIGKIEARESQLPLYRKRENELFNIERVIYNYHNNTNKIPDDAELLVDFAELSFPKSPDERIKQDEFDLRHNITTEIDILKRSNPDLTDDMAKQQYAENKAVNEANMPQGIELKQVQQPGANNAKSNQSQGREKTEGSDASKGQQTSKGREKTN